MLNYFGNNSVKRKISVYACVIIIIFAILFPVVAIAAGESENPYQAQINAIVNKIKYGGDDGFISEEDLDETTDEYKARMQILDYLENDAASDSSSVILESNGEFITISPWTTGTIKSGYTVIENAMKAVETSGTKVSAADKQMFTSEWKAQFRSTAESLGLMYSTSDDSAGSAEASSLEAAGRKMNILTWDNNEKSNGSGYLNENSGVLKSMLSVIDSELAGDFFTVLRDIGVALVLAFGIGKMLGLTMDRNVSGEAVTREFIKMLAGAWFVFNFKFFALLMIYAGSAFSSLLIGSISTGEGYAYIMQYSIYDGLYNTLAGGMKVTGSLDSAITGVLAIIGNNVAGLTNSVSGLLSPVINAIGNGIVQIASSLVVYSLVIEIGVRYAFTPIAIADLYSERFRSSGWNWLKRLFACALAGCVMYMMVWVCEIFKNTLNTIDPITNTCINLTMVGGLARSKSIANEIIGAH